MYLTCDHLLGGRTMTRVPEDLTYIVRYNWTSTEHRKEAIKIILSARLHECNKDAQTKMVHGNSESPQTDIHQQVALGLVKNPCTSLQTLSYLATCGTAKVLERIAEHHNACPELLHELALHHSPEVRTAVADNSNTSITTLYMLADDDHVDVRYCLAENQNLPNSILEQLSHDENPYVASRAMNTLDRQTLGVVVEGRFPNYLNTQRLKASGLEE